MNWLRKGYLANNMIYEIMILAGGMGTRLRSSVPDLPKVMAPVDGKPFIYFVIEHLRSQGISKYIFLLGFKSEIVISYLDKHYPDLNKIYVVEDQPLGTGGAIKLGLSYCESTEVGVTNGDTLFRVQLDELYNVHKSNNSDCSLAVKPLKNYERYGSVMIENDLSISSFTEKQFMYTGHINTGFYILNKNSFLNLPLSDIFSFEKDYLENTSLQKRLFSSIQDKYFIDIGIPEDYIKAQQELKLQ